MGSLLELARQPEMLLPLAIVLLLILAQYRRIAGMERALYGAVLHPPGEQLVHSLVTGMAGGILASLLFLILGIALPDSGILPVWILALVLMLIHPRFLCFSYAGGLVALSYLLFGFPHVNVAGLMGLVAILHLVEAVLIRFTGGLRAMPVFVRHHDGRVVGGFALQKFWPVPFFALLALVAPELASPGTGVVMPDWWPLIGAVGSGGMYVLFPVAAALGYGDMAVTSTPQQKARRTSNHLFAYSVGLLVLAVLATNHTAWAFVAALYSPLAHEWVIYAGRRSERIGEPLFSEDRGVMVLATLPGSVGAALDLRAGDIIRRFNGQPIRHQEDLMEAMNPWALNVELHIENGLTGEHRVIRHPGKVPPLGVILVPSRNDGGVVHFGRLGPLGRWLARQRARFSA